MTLPNKFSGLLLSLIALVGCGIESSTPSSAVTPRATPREVYAKFQQELTKGDVDAALAFASGSPKALGNLRLLHSFVTTLVDFRERMIQEYGEEGWLTFNDSDGAHLTSTEVMTPLSAEQLERFPVIYEGSSLAFVWTAHDKEWLRLVLVDDQWKIDADALVPSDEGEKFQVFGLWAEVMRNNLKQIGKEGITPDTLDGKIGGELLRAVLRTSP